MRGLLQGQAQVRRPVLELVLGLLVPGLESVPEWPELRALVLEQVLALGLLVRVLGLVPGLVLALGLVPGFLALVSPVLGLVLARVLEQVQELAPELGLVLERVGLDPFLVLRGVRGGIRVCVGTGFG